MDLGDGPGRWTWKNDLENGLNGLGDLHSNDSNYKFTMLLRRMRFVEVKETLASARDK